MYSFSPKLDLAYPKLSPLVAAPITAPSPPALKSHPDQLQTMASIITSALPFMVALLLIAGFALAIAPLVHDLPVFLAQSALR
jgi:hypothetical protein